jgi:alcohol dehydrogenase
MKMVVATRFGGPDVLALVDRPAPTPRPDDVTIDVRAASLNPIDFKLREGKLKLVVKTPPPVALGCDVAGVVSAVGPEATGFAVGDEVYARLEKGRMGGLAEQVCAAASVVAKKPQLATFAQAASVPLAALTALQALREVAAATPGQRALIQAGAGGVGTLAIQIAKILGLHVTTTTSTKNLELVKDLGADAVVDYTKASIADEPPFDVVFETLDAASELRSIAATKRGGVVVGIGGLPDGAFAKERLPWFARPAIWAMTSKRRRAAAKAGVRFAYYFMRPDGAQLAEIAGWIDARKLRTVIHETYPLARFADAFAELERGRARGKIVVEI